MDKIPVSVGILTHNSGTTLARALESVQNFDDLVLIDGGSTDETLDIARQYGARIISQSEEFKGSTGALINFGGVRNQALNAARHDWFLYIDSDESISEGLREDIRGIVSSANALSDPLVYRVPIGILLADRYLRYSANYPGYQYRFFNRKSLARFTKPVHERIEFDPSVTIGTLTHPWYIHTEKQDWQNYFRDGARYRDIAVQKFVSKPWREIGKLCVRNLRAAAGITVRASRNYLLHGFADAVPFSGEVGRVLDALALSVRVVSAKLFGRAVTTSPSNHIAYVAYVRMPTERAHGLQIMKTLEALVECGESVELIVPTRRNSLEAEDPFEYYGVRVRFPITYIHAPDLVAFGPLGFLLGQWIFSRRVRRHMRVTHPKLVYSRDEHVLRSSKPELAFIWESHTGSWNSAAQWCAARAQKMVVLTQSAREWYAKKGVPEARMLVAPDGVDLSVFQKPEPIEIARARLGLPSHTKIILYVGSLGGWKGTDTLLQSAAYLSSDSTVALIGGDVDVIHTLALAYPDVRFLGPRPYRELPDNLAAADVLVLPNTATDPVSVLFTSPLKLFAYMASGRPIVASDIPSIREVLDESCAYLVPPDDPHGLSKGILEAIDHPAEASMRASIAAQKVQQYSWEHRARTILQAV